MPDSSNDRFELLQLHALTAFSDACTIPTLTPTCPFYHMEDPGPRCSEECRSALHALGVDRAEREVAVAGGMIMTGRPMPIEVASGYTPFDATRQLLIEQGMPLGRRSTGTLLLELRSHATTAPASRTHPDAEFYNLVDELTRRTVPVESVLRAAVAPAIATAVLRLVEADMAYDLPDWVRAYDVCRTMVPEAPGAYERWFAAHAEGWLARIVDGDGSGFLGWKAPPPAVLANMPAPVPDTAGKWVWDRFTRARLEEWSTTSLLMEWRHLRGSSLADISPRLLGARAFDIPEIANAALERVADGIEPSTEVARSLSSGTFVQQAIEHLQEGEPAKAAEIFAALVVVSPADGDALNNLGFCQLPSDPEMALKVLDRASSFSSERPAINLANRAFARHLLGQDEEALALLDQVPATADPGNVWMWEEDRCGEFRIQLYDSLNAYVSGLRAHIGERAGSASILPT